MQYTFWDSPPPVSSMALRECGFEGQRYAERLDRMQTATHYASVVNTAAGGSGTAPSSL
jgi:hypothetical protein